MECRWVYMTAETREEAEKIGKALVERRLAACVNIIGNMTSMYWWEGEVQTGSETVLIAKTVAAHVPALVEAVKAEHSYSCPCVIALPILDGNPDFLDWIRSETSPREN
ncbi:MAG: divalent-cation tolerance protein CutA [SAR324 cluster bacterium]|nr:divalent-cation tolerance protein CutA [SAR324 cluster bacterium]MCZ6647533.1 divalent-cation tolerance protein CutA [SAR324 cluster bacterium]